MPINRNLQPVDLPMELKFGRKPKTQFHNNLDALKVELVDHPTRQQAWNVAWHYVKATWADRPDIDPTRGVTERELSKNLEDVDRKSTRLNSSHVSESRMPSSA